MKAIYLLSDPDGAPRYVGQAWEPGGRYDQHIGQTGKRSRRGNEKHGWIDSLLARGERPILSILEVVREEDAGILELLWLGHFLLKGCEMVNCQRDRRCLSGFTPEKIEQSMRRVRLGLKVGDPLPEEPINDH